MHGMLNYFIRRILLIPITFLAITLMVYTIVRVAPGGPIEQLEAQLKSAGAEGGGGSAGAGVDVGLDDAAKEELRRYYNLDRPIVIGYLQWLGALPKSKERSVQLEERRLEPEFWQQAEQLLTTYRAEKLAFEGVLRDRDWRLIEDTFYRPLSATTRSAGADVFARADELLAGGPSKRSDLEKYLEKRGYALSGTEFFESISLDRVPPEIASDVDVAVAAKEKRDSSLEALETHLEEMSCGVSRNLTFFHKKTQFSGILQGDFGESFQYNKPVLQVIVSKFKISIFLGLMGYFAAWFICVPLGVLKAVKHRSRFDTMSSLVVFLGYSVPGWVAALLLLVWFGGGSYFDLVPLGGFRSPDWDIWWENGEFWRCAVDQAHHMLVPVFGYLIGSFAAMTILMKNSLLENLGADYVRTAFAKGLSERRVILVHTLRNSMIPITAGVGHAIGLVFAGSFLIEKVCNIPGMGLLGFEAILQRDFPIILGILVFIVLAQLIGNIISDLVWALIDPRIRFE